MTTTAQRPAMADARPEAGRAEIEKLAGDPTKWQPISGDRGVEVWRVTGPQGEWALKVGREEGAAVVAREAAVMTRVGGLASATSYGRRAQWGRAATSAWLATPWLAGKTLWEAFQPTRDGRTDYEAGTRAAVDACMAVAALHQCGWVHGDVQPHHVILMPGGARLIDWAWGWHASMPPSFAYNGGMVHLMAPELMGQVQRPVQESQSAEAWSLAASIWWSASNRCPRDYRALGIDPATFTAATLRKVLVHKPAPLGHMPGCPQLEQVLRTVLEAPASDRPGALDLAQRLREITP